MAPSQAYSDLIYLFLDGEATETERSVLFGALKDSPALQEEFASAVQVRGALVSDAMKLQAPAYLEGQIIEKAGLLASKLSVGSVASSALTTAPTAATPFLLKAGLLILTGAAAGVATLVGIQNASKTSTPSKFANNAAARTAVERIRPDLATPAAQQAPTQNVATPAAPQAMTAVPSNAPIATTSANNTNTTNTASNATHAPSLHAEASNVSAHRSSAVKNTTASSTTQRTQESHAQHNNTNSARRENLVTNAPSSTKTPAQPVVDPAGSKNMSDNSTPVAKLPESAVSEAPHTVLPAMIRTDGSGSHDIRVGDQSTERNPLRANEFRSTGDDFVSRLSAQLNWLGTLGMSAGRDVHGDDHSAMNFAAGVNLDVSSHMSVGLRYGNESFPIYLKSGGEYEPTYAITWGGASVNYTFNTEPILGARIFAEVDGGISNPGPIVRPEVGAKFELNENMSVSASASDMYVFFRNNGTTTSGHKWGLNAGLIIRL